MMIASYSEWQDDRGYSASGQPANLSSNYRCLDDQDCWWDGARTCIFRGYFQHLETIRRRRSVVDLSSDSFFDKSLCQDKREREKERKKTSDDGIGNF